MLETDDYAPDGKPWQITELTNTQGMKVTFMDWGATWISAQVPLADHSLREVLLGCGTPARYLQQQAYLGATVGRYANRIRHSFLTRLNRQLASNQGEHQLHGGPIGFSHQRWQTINSGRQHLHYRLFSADGDQGFPGNLTVDLRITLDDANRLTLHFTAKSDAQTPLSLTNHAYFNLDRHHGDVRQHQLQLNAAEFQPVDSEGLPIGTPQMVDQTHFDFRLKRSIAENFLADEIQQKVGGYDHAFVLDTKGVQRPAARLVAADRQLVLTLYTSEPALQVYTGNFLAGTPARQGEYQNYQGIALEPGYLPDAANKNKECWLDPGVEREIIMRYQFTSA